MHQFHNIPEIYTLDHYKSYYNLYPYYTTVYVDTFLSVRNKYYFLAEDLDSNHVTYKLIHHICNNVLSKYRKNIGNLLFQLGILINKNRYVQFPCTGNTKLSCHASGNHKGF